VEGADEVPARGDRELREDVLEVVLHRVLADTECRGNILVGLPINKGPDDLYLAAGETQARDLHFGGTGSLNDCRCIRVRTVAIGLATSLERTALTNDVNKIRNHCSTDPESALKDGIDALGEQLLCGTPRNNAVGPMPENFNDAAAVQHVRHDERSNGTRGVNLIKKSAKLFPFNIQVENDELRFEGLQERDDF